MVQPGSFLVQSIFLAVMCLLVGIMPALGQAPPGGPFRPQPGRSTGPTPGEIREGAVPPSAKGLYITEQPGNVLLATEYIGRPVQGPEGQRVGSVSNLLVDSTGRITGVVIEVGGFLGLRAKEVALTFEALYPVVEDGREMLVIELTKDQLTAAPAFKRSR
jgi:hypothetical protein